LDSTSGARWPRGVEGQGRMGRGEEWRGGGLEVGGHLGEKGLK